MFSAMFTISTSVVLGAIALAFVAVQFPAFLQDLLNSAGWIEDRITGTGLNPAYNVWVLFLIDQRQIAFLGFVILTRITLAVFLSSAANALGVGSRRRA